MNTIHRVVELGDYKKTRKLKMKSKCINNDLFSIEAVEVSSVMKFVDKLPDIEISKEDLDSYLLATTPPSIEIVLTTIYLAEYLGLNIDLISNNNIQNASEFISGVYNLKHSTETETSYIFKIDPKNRSIWIDGYNLIINLIEN